MGSSERPSRRFYSRSQVVAVEITGAIFLFIFVSGLLASDTIGIRIFILVVILGMGVVAVRIIRSGVEAFDRSVRVKNVFSTYELSWREIDRFEVGQSGLLPMVCLIHLKDGSKKHAFGIQERTNFPDGSAEAMVDELNAELARRVGIHVDST